jgi:hypothetical protein
MGVADNIQSTTAQSKLWPKYATRVDPESAKELLEARIAASAAAPGVTPAPAPIPEGAPPAAGSTPPPAPKAAKPPKAEKPKESAVTDFLKSSQGKQIQNQLIRGAFGILKSKI